MEITIKGDKEFDDIPSLNSASKSPKKELISVAQSLMNQK